MTPLNQFLLAFDGMAFLLLVLLIVLINLDSYLTNREIRRQKPMTRTELDYARKHDRSSIYYLRRD